VISNKEKKRRINLFKSEFNRFVDYFGIYDYEIYFEENKKIKEYKAYIEVEHLISNKESNGQIVLIFYTTFWIIDKNTKDDEIKKVAFHEFLELLLIKLRDYAVNTSVVISEREIDVEVHRIIRILENTIYKRGLIK
jgi:hypothetical protein